jgi:hypothetical protein
LRPCEPRPKPPETWHRAPVNRKAEGFLPESGLGRLTGTAAASAFTWKDVWRRFNMGTSMWIDGFYVKGTRIDCALSPRRERFGKRVEGGCKMAAMTNSTLDDLAWEPELFFEKEVD